MSQNQFGSAARVRTPITDAEDQRVAQAKRNYSPAKSAAASIVGIVLQAGFFQLDLAH
jgi:hypothetical protein